MPLYRLAPIALAALLTTGCISSTTVIKVGPDGSGTIEQTMMANLQAMKMMLSGLDPQGTSSSSGIASEAELKRAAERMGKGVRVVSTEPVKSGGFEGARAVFAFDDIRELRVDQDPGGTGDMMPSSGRTADPVTFGLTRRPDGTSVLTVTMADPPETPATAAGEAGGMMSTDAFGDPQMLAMIKGMFEGFRVSIDLEVAGTILKTNADHVAGSRVTLLEMDLGALFEDEAALKALEGRIGPGTSVSEMRPHLKNLKGLKVNDPVVTIEFR
jgi:hypothetical protein